jgi:hypothetical protein
MALCNSMIFFLVSSVPLSIHMLLLCLVDLDILDPCLPVHLAPPLGVQWGPLDHLGPVARGQT